jgi:hypothetical protein
MGQRYITARIFFAIKILYAFVSKKNIVPVIEAVNKKCHHRLILVASSIAVNVL